ncbi:MAG: hypothetical protein JNM62_11055 [Flavobacteriales bacterium]|nr:hypothetical protein [Flavobacteriales bacterium]
MATKRFRTARYWHNALLMFWGVPFLVLPGIIVGASSGNFALLWVSIGVSVAAIALAAKRDRRKSVVYELDETRLVIVDGNERHAYAMNDIADASLLDRAAAREYLREMIQSRGAGADAAGITAVFEQHCTVDIGLVSYTLGLGRALIDRMPNAKNDLVLVRLRNGEARALSPLHAQDFVESLNRRKLL